MTALYLCAFPWLSCRRSTAWNLTGIEGGRRVRVRVPGMGNKTQNKGRTKTRTSKKTSTPGASKTKKPNAAVGMGPAKDRFVNALLVRGEAATPDSSGKVPLDATHVIEKQNEDGTVAVRRVRYKLF